MLNAITRKLSHLVDLSADDRELLKASMGRVQHYPAHADIIREGNDPSCLNIVLDGWACRYKQLEDGRRQVLALFVPGDMCDPCVFMLQEMSHALATLTPTTIARVSEAAVVNAMKTSKSLNKAFWLEMLISAEVQREWTVNLGRRTATERMAHLCCEMMVRLRAVGMADGSSCEMPVTQADLSDILGLSAVHVNRTLQELRATGYMELRSRKLTIRNESALRAIALFTPDYLHLHHRSPE